MGCSSSRVEAPTETEEPLPVPRVYGSLIYNDASQGTLELHLTADSPAEGALSPPPARPRTPTPAAPAVSAAALALIPPSSPSLEPCTPLHGPPPSPSPLATALRLSPLPRRASRVRSPAVVAAP